MGIYQPDTFEVDLATGKTTSFWMYTPDGGFPKSVAW
jgi:dipeptidyl aminopeptidase/acylaminoacyl peptidase